MIVVGVHIYVVDQKKFDRTLSVDSPFKTLAVGLLVDL